MPFVIAAAARILLYIVFIVGPSIVAFHFIFSRMTSVKLDDVSKADSRYTPFIPAMIEGRDFIAAKDPEEVEIKSSDGLTLAADYVDRGSDRTAIFLHGYHSDAGVNVPIQGKMFWEEGFNLILVDQRAHARSGGNRSTLGVLEGGDAVKWCEYAVSRGADKIVLYGLSMGASALTLAADRFDPETVRTLVVDCGFASPYEQLICECKRRKLPWRNADKDARSRVFHPRDCGRDRSGRTEHKKLRGVRRRKGYLPDGRRRPHRRLPRGRGTGKRRDVLIYKQKSLSGGLI